MTKIACFITPHGFGHATRMTGVLEALQRRIPNLQPQLFTTVPQSLFGETLESFSYHPLACDIGLVQKNGLETDLAETCRRLDEFLPFNDVLLEELAEKIEDCRLVLCDIAPLGIAVAKRAGIPAVLIENFTWDWIYRAYLPRHPELQGAIDYLGEQYRQADIHIRTEPVCGPSRGDHHCGPIFRRIRSGRAEVRKRLGIGGQKTVFISTGGVGVELPFVQQLTKLTDITFLLAGQQENRQLADNVILLARDSGIYHPDLISGSDLVVCKSGYSTVAECMQAGVPVVTVGRATFPESAILEEFCASHLDGQVLEQETFLSGRWLQDLDDLLSRQRKPPLTTNGADRVAEILIPRLSPAHG